MNLDGLNDCQKRAVKQTEGPVLIIAGAGSGKTRVLTNRIAYLIDECGISPYNILAITFTNKAANEMKERVYSILGDDASGMFVSTIHSFCVRLLREDIHKMGDGYPRNFTIVDSDDQKSILKEAYKMYGIEVKSYSYANVLSYISACKGEEISPEANTITLQLYEVKNDTAHQVSEEKMDKDPSDDIYEESTVYVYNEGESPTDDAIPIGDKFTVQIR